MQRKRHNFFLWMLASLLLHIPLVGLLFIFAVLFAPVGGSITGQNVLQVFIVPLEQPLLAAPVIPTAEPLVVPDVIAQIAKTIIPPVKVETKIPPPVKQPDKVTKPSLPAIGTVNQGGMAAKPGNGGKDPQGSGNGSGDAPNQMTNPSGNNTVPEGTDVGTGNGAPSGPTSGAAVVSLKTPSYPKDVQELELEGTVQVRVIVGTDGKPDDVQIYKGSANQVLDKLAKDAAWRSSYKTALRNGAAVVDTVNVEYSFDRSGRIGKRVVL